MKRAKIVRFLNWRGPCGFETIDEACNLDFPTDGDFYRELRRLRREYALAGTSGEWRVKPCKDYVA